MALKRKAPGKTGKAVAPLKNAIFVERIAPTPTYPLFPSEIEIIAHVAWDGKTFQASTRSPKDSESLTGEELHARVTGAPFDPVLRAHDRRLLTLNIANGEDLAWIEPRSHRIYVVTSTGKLPDSFNLSVWNTGKPGVKKDDGIAILLSRSVK